MYFKVTRESNNSFTEAELSEEIVKMINTIANKNVQVFVSNSVYGLTINKDSFLSIAIVSNNNDAGNGNMFKVILASKFNIDGLDNVLIYTQHIYINDDNSLAVLPQVTTTKLVSNITWDTKYHNTLWL